MTAITLRAVLAQVPVVFVVTARALRRSLHFARRRVMAIGALQFAVGAPQWKVRLLRVIENP
jgi:hypothetical protein